MTEEDFINSIPFGWRLLGDDEEIKPGDRYDTFDQEFKSCYRGGWKNVRTSIGLTPRSYWMNTSTDGRVRFKVIRAKKYTAVTTAPVPEPVIGIDNINISFELNE